MAHPFGRAGFMPLRTVIDLFTAMGCEYKEHVLRLSDGTVWTTRYIENPQTGYFVPLADYDDDELVQPGVINGWEAVLDCVIPRPGGVH